MPVKRPGRPTKAPETVNTGGDDPDSKERPGITQQEILDAVRGHLQRANELISMLS